MPFKWVEISSFENEPEFIAYLEEEKDSATLVDVSGQNEARVKNLNEKGIVAGDERYTTEDGMAFLAALANRYNNTSRLAASFIKSGDELPEFKS